MQGMHSWPNPMGPLQLWISQSAVAKSTNDMPLPRTSDSLAQTAGSQPGGQVVVQITGMGLKRPTGDQAAYQEVAIFFLPASH